MSVLLRRAALQLPEAGREVALGGKTAFQRDLRDAQIGSAKELSALTDPILQEIGKQCQSCCAAEKAAAFTGTQMDVAGDGFQGDFFRVMGIQIKKDFLQTLIFGGADIFPLPRTMLKTPGQAPSSALWMSSSLPGIFGCSESSRIRKNASVRRRPSGVLLSKRKTEDVDK